MNKLTHIEEVKEALKNIQKEWNSLNRGPISYTMEILFAAHDYLMEHHAPFKAGDRVMLIKEPDTNNGWDSSKHFLIHGAKATVHEIAFSSKGNFGVSVVFDNETWIPSSDTARYKAGEPQPVSSKHQFSFTPEYLTRIVE